MSRVRVRNVFDVKWHKRFFHLNPCFSTVNHFIFSDTKFHSNLSFSTNGKTTRCYFICEYKTSALQIYVHGMYQMCSFGRHKETFPFQVRKTMRVKRYFSFDEKREACERRTWKCVQLLGKIIIVSFLTYFALYSAQCVNMKEKLNDTCSKKKLKVKFVDASL